jgi:hypothetical protein
MEYELKWMPGDRTDGYYYFTVKDTDFVWCRNGHPNFPVCISESQEDYEEKALKFLKELNGQSTQ